MPMTVLDGPVIQAGQSLSAALDVSAGQIMRIIMPPAWDGANLTFQSSPDGVTFYDLRGVNGQELTLAVVPGSVVALSSVTDYLKEWHIKIRSGSAAAPVVQSAIRNFKTVMQT